jgi:4-aminobutyrate aminotransferase / (S)-3-amino-2-methylpropionate transaminase / 5-aminovalerate transaminase
MKSPDLTERRLASVPRGVAVATDIWVQHAENAELWDTEGRRYVDFAGGVAVLNTGHRHPKVMGAVRRQLDLFTHTSFQIVPYAAYVTLAERLNALAPCRGPNKTLFLTTGAEAVENAIKISRAATKRSAVIAFRGGFHGRTLMTLALTGKVDPYKKDFGPFPGEVYHVPFPVSLHGISTEDSIAALEALFAADVEPTRVAAIIIEPVQGEGGFYIAPFEFLRELRTICDRYGILLIADEIQTGFGRTGKMFAIEHSGVCPDLITTAKSLAGGLPLSAVTGRAAVMDAVEPGGLGGTFAGNPVACAAALAVIETMREERLLERSAAIGEKLTQRLSRLAGDNRCPCIGEVRGLGGMVAVEMMEDQLSRKPAIGLARRWAELCHHNGLVVLACGIYGNVIRILVPLTASDAIVDEGLAILERCWNELAARDDGSHAVPH